MTRNSIFVSCNKAQLCRVCKPYSLALALVREVHDEISHDIVLHVVAVALLRKRYDQIGHGRCVGRGSVVLVY